MSELEIVNAYLNRNDLFVIRIEDMEYLQELISRNTSYYEDSDRIEELITCVLSYNGIIIQ